MVLLRAKAPPPPRPWENAPEVDYRLYKDRIKMARSYNSTIVTLKRLILRESACESEGTQFVTDEDPVDTLDGKFNVHKIPQLPLAKHKYFIVNMYPPEDLSSDDTPLAGDEKIKFLFSFFNLYLIGVSYDEIWNIFDDAMIVGISQEARDLYLKKLGFPGDYKTVGQNYLKLCIGFAGQCDTYNQIVVMRSKKTSDEQLIAALCRTIITLPESARFAFLLQFHLGNFHSGNLDIVLDKLVLAGEEYKNFSLHLTKWGTYSTMSKKGKKLFNAALISTSGITSFNGLLNFISIATNKKYDQETKLLEFEVKKAHNSGDGGIDDKGGNQGQNEDKEESRNNDKTDEDNYKTWFYQAPVMPYVPHGRQNLNLVSEADVSTYAMLEIDRKTPLDKLCWTFLLQLAMREACKYVEVKVSGGGAVEAALSIYWENQDTPLRSRKQLAITEFAESSPKLDDDLTLEGPSESPGMAKAMLVECTSQPLCGPSILAADLAVDDTKYPIKSINIFKAHGKSAKESCLLNGYAPNSSRAAQGMPTRVSPARIACLDFDFQKTKLQMGVLVPVSDPCELEKIPERESNIRKELTEKVLKAGANVVFTTEGINNMSLKVTAGGEAAALSVYLENQAITVGSREQLAIAEFAESLLKVDDGPALEWPWESPGRGGGSVEAAAVYACLENQVTALGSREQLAIGEFAESSLEVDDEPMPEGPWESPGMAKARVVECTSHPLCGPSILNTNLDARKWYGDRAQEDLEHHDHLSLGRLGIVV